MFNQLRYFISVVKNQSFTRAAAECHISQPAISQQIKELEENLGVHLLDRKGRKFTLTDAGQYFYQHSEELLIQVDNLIENTQKIGKKNREPYILKIGYLYNFGTNEFLKTISDFSKKYPDVRVRITLGSHEKLFELIQNNEVDMNFSDLRRAQIGSFINEHLTTSNFQVVIDEHFFKDKVVISGNDLKGFTCLLLVDPTEQQDEENYYRNILGIDGPFALVKSVDEANLLIASGKYFMIMNNRTASMSNVPTISKKILVHDGQPVFQEYYAFWKKKNSGFYIETFAQMLKKKFNS